MPKNVQKWQTGSLYSFSRQTIFMRKLNMDLNFQDNVALIIGGIK